MVRNSNDQIHELKDMKNFIYPQEERGVDSEVEITERIIAHYSPSNQDQDKEGSVNEDIKKVSVSEAILALNTLKLFEEQRDQPVD